eukprot:CAMPEP_0119329078 /NCGR_PEP_ID=MMETSP1333-20130426/75007_1 /TAXON_ID=418940 /ORGANISM="Scyphosphaera apsteinii, Strain RCC1455" /LENGTH=43 /DNA_ID= /DNA_START= /DNA_END= /DNA_ORIENTATION=
MIASDGANTPEVHGIFLGIGPSQTSSETGHGHKRRSAARIALG